MLLRIRRVAAALLFLIGTAHVLMTFAIYGELSPRAVWFAGAGVALMVIALANMPAVPSRPVVAGTNALGAALAAFAVVAVPEPQAFAAAALVVTLLVLSLARGGAGSASA